MSDDKNDKKGSSFRGAAMKVVGVVVAVIVILLGLSFGGDGGGGLVYVDEARGEQCQLFRGAGVLSAEDENAVRSGSEGISAKEADASADVIEVSGLPSGGGSPVYIVRQFGESDVVIKSGVCFFSLSEAAVNAIDNPAELKTSTEEASPEGVPVGEIPAGDSGAAGGEAGGEQGGLSISPGDVREAASQGEYASIFDMPRTTPGLYIAGVVVIGIVVAGLWVLRLSVERTKYTDTFSLEGTLGGRGRSPTETVDKVRGEYTVDVGVTVRNADALNPALLILRRQTPLREVARLAGPVIRNVVSDYGMPRLLSEYEEMESKELEAKVEAALKQLERDQQVEFEIVLSNADLDDASRAWYRRVRDVDQYADEFARFCSRLGLDVHNFHAVLLFLGKSLGNFGEATQVFASAFAEYVQDHGKALEAAAERGGK